jgi:hypothetical protein
VLCSACSRVVNRQNDYPGARHPPPGGAGPQGQGTNEARQQARPEVARSGARHKGDRKDDRPIGTAGRTSAAPTPSHQGPDRISRRQRRSAEGEGEMMERRRVGSPTWTEADDERLRSLAVAGMNSREIAMDLNRSVFAIRARSEKLGVSLKQVMVKRRP